MISVFTDYQKNFWKWHLDLKADGTVDVKCLIINFEGLGVLGLFFIIFLKKSVLFLAGWAYALKMINFSGTIKLSKNFQMWKKEKNLKKKYYGFENV